MEYFLAGLILVGGILGFWSSRSGDRQNSAKQYVSLLDLPVAEEKISQAQLAEPLGGQKQAFISKLPGSPDPIVYSIRIPEKIGGQEAPEVSAQSVIILDMQSEAILFEKNCYQKFPIASLSKIFTALVAREHLSEEPIEISKKAVETEGNAGGLKTGEKFNMKELSDLMLISSSNDAAAQIAFSVSGDFNNFSKLMDEKAENYGLKNTHFADPSGLNKENVSTAFEFALFAKKTFEETPVWDVLKKPFAEIKSADGVIHRLENTNELISLEYVLAGKTGYTSDAKGALAIIANSGQNNRNIVAVILGSSDRFKDMEKLLEWARGNFKCEEQGL
ncbi:MAG: serine hydrolase [bacterium]